MKDKIETVLKTLSDNCEQEGEAGDRLPSSPQTEGVPPLAEEIKYEHQ